jgi:hypothetical protein
VSCVSSQLSLEKASEVFIQEMFITDACRAGIARSRIDENPQRKSALLVAL